MTAEQQARDMLERLEHPRAQELSTGDLVELANLISAVSQFKPDVAYMPVPRCKTCKHWKRGQVNWRIGTCVNPELRAWEVGQTIYTCEDFGCVQWEEK